MTAALLFALLLDPGADAHANDCFPRGHISRSLGFTGWIGGVAVFDRALAAIAASGPIEIP